VSIKERQALAERLPWVTRLKADDIPCDGVKYSTVAMKDLYSWGSRGENPPRGIQPRSRCKKKAHWHYVGLQSRPYFAHGKTGNLCWDHLVCEALEIEHARIEKYINRYLKEYV
jgi:hypothetical protein